MKRVLLGVGIVVLALGGAAAVRLWIEISKSLSEDPLVWEETIAGFEQEDGERPPPEAPIVFVGSSSIRLWDSLAEDMAPLATLNRGFGGSKVGDVIYYADRIISRYQPRAVVIFVGSNDLGAGLGNVPKTPEAVLVLTRELAVKIRAPQPRVPIYWLAVKPTTTDPTRWERGQVLNRLVADWAAGEPGVHFLDANAELLTAEGDADPHFLMIDGIHLNGGGYAVWAPPIRERLLADLGSPGR